MDRTPPHEGPALWIFGYGSLMWDGWEMAHGCSQCAVATLDGFRRAFNKASIRNWGTAQTPGPTLNLVRDGKASCRGVAFGFPDESRSRVLGYLSDREGKDFALREHTVRLDGAGAVVALVPLYEGRRLIDCADIDELADRVSRAVGTRGEWIDYVKNVASRLGASRIDDPAVSDLIDALRRRGRVC